jgi:hypothetical protein
MEIIMIWTLVGEDEQLLSRTNALSLPSSEVTCTEHWSCVDRRPEEGMHILIPFQIDEVPEHIKLGTLV